MFCFAGWGLTDPGVWEGFLISVAWGWGMMAIAAIIFKIRGWREIRTNRPTFISVRIRISIKSRVRSMTNARTILYPVCCFSMKNQSTIYRSNLARSSGELRWCRTKHIAHQMIFWSAVALGALVVCNIVILCILSDCLQTLKRLTFHKCEKGPLCECLFTQIQLIMLHVQLWVLQRFTRFNGFDGMPLDSWYFCGLSNQCDIFDVMLQKRIKKKADSVNEKLCEWDCLCPTLSHKHFSCCFAFALSLELILVKMFLIRSSICCPVRAKTFFSKVLTLLVLLLCFCNCRQCNILFC